MILSKPKCFSYHNGQIFKIKHSLGDVFLSNKDVNDIMELFYRTKTTPDLKLCLKKYKLYLLLSKIMSLKKTDLKYLNKSGKEKYTELKIKLQNKHIYKIFFVPDIFFKQYASGFLEEIFSTKSKFKENEQMSEFKNINSCDFVILKNKEEIYYLHNGFLNNDQYDLFDLAQKYNTFKFKNKTFIVLERGKKSLSEMNYEYLTVNIPNAKQSDVLEFIDLYKSPSTLLQQLKKKFKHINFFPRTINDTNKDPNDQRIIQLLKQYKIYLYENNNHKSVVLFILLGTFESNQSFQNNEDNHNNYDKAIKYVCNFLF